MSTFEYTPQLLESMQQIELEMLTELDRICRENEISREFSWIPARRKHPFSMASGRSVEVRMQIAGKGRPIEV